MYVCMLFKAQQQYTLHHTTQTLVPTHMFHVQMFKLLCMFNTSTYVCENESRGFQ